MTARAVVDSLRGVTDSDVISVAEAAAIAVTRVRDARVVLKAVEDGAVVGTAAVALLSGCLCGLCGRDDAVRDRVAAALKGALKPFLSQSSVELLVVLALPGVGRALCSDAWSEQAGVVYREIVDVFGSFVSGGLSSEDKARVERFAIPLGGAIIVYAKCAKCDVGVVQFLQAVAMDGTGGTMAVALVCAAARGLGGALGVDVLGLLKTQDRGVVYVSAASLLPSLAERPEEIEAVAAVAGSLLALDGDAGAEARPRVTFLLRVLSYALVMHGAEQSAAAMIETDSVQSSNVWRNICVAITACVAAHWPRTGQRRRSDLSDLLQAVLDAGVAIVACEAGFLSGVRGQLAVDLCETLIAAGTLVMATSVDLARVLDAAVAGAVPAGRVEDCIRGLSRAFRTERANQRRLAVLLLMRCVTRCELCHLNSILDAASELVESAGDDERGEVLRIARSAVMGTDCVRKERCLSWLLEQSAIYMTPPTQLGASSVRQKLLQLGGRFAKL